MMLLSGGVPGVPVSATPAAVFPLIMLRCPMTGLSRSDSALVVAENCCCSRVALLILTGRSVLNSSDFRGLSYTLRFERNSFVCVLLIGKPLFRCFAMAAWVMMPAPNIEAA